MTTGKSKKSIKLFSNNSSLICWVNIKSVATGLPALYSLDSLMLILKQPSPEVKPAIHWGCNLVLLSNKKWGLNW